LLVVKAAYFTEPETSVEKALPVSAPVQILSLLLVAAMIAGGLYPGPLIELANMMAAGLKAF
jgi:NADH:ubiquinone oxidoreductase subunit 2 (subunit N)